MECQRVLFRFKKPVVMNIIVWHRHVPDTKTKIPVTADHTSLNTAAIQYIINPYDEIALAKAIELTDGTDGTVTVINVGEAATDATIRKALAIGAHGAGRGDAARSDEGRVGKECVSSGSSRWAPVH